MKEYYYGLDYWINTGLGVPSSLPPERIIL